MDSIRWQKIETLVEGALAVPTEERAAWLDENCALDKSLRAEVESLLAVEHESEKFLRKPAVAKIAGFFNRDESSLDADGRRVGPYKILREIGRGGMGLVYLAERDDEEFRQRVAIKLIKRGMDTDALLGRFRAERQILAALDHPNIARLLDGGTTDDGLPYIVMEYVEGTAITRYCDEQKLSTNQRLRLFRTVCAAVQHAHQNLVVHRDLKPSNILVTSNGEPKLLDFGIAKILNPDLSPQTLAQTATVARLMTPGYASPEQIRGGNITTVSDVYSLGVLLYRLLTGHAPYRFTNLSPQEIERLVCEAEPEKPSTAISRTEEITTGRGTTRITPEAVGEARGELTEALRRRLKGDMDNIVLKALRKEPERRYSSAAQLSEDIRRYMNSLTVTARKDTFSYRASKFIGRNKAGVVAAALFCLAVLAGLTASIWQARVAARERDQARRETAKAEQLNNFLQSILSAASPEEKGKEAKVIEVLNEAAGRIDTEFANQPELKAQALLTIGQTYAQLGLIEEAEKHLRQALKISAELFGENNRVTSSSMVYLGAALMNKGKLAEAESLLNKAIEVERRLSTSGSKELAFALFACGELYVRKGDYERAKPLLQESIGMSDKLHGERNEDSAVTLISLGRAEQYSGNSGEAEANYRRSIEIFRALPERFEGRMAMALINLGWLLTLKGHYEEGITALHEGDRIFQKQGESFFLFQSKLYLCMTYFNKSDYQAAIEKCGKSVEIGRGVGLAETPDFLFGLNFLGLSLTRTGRAKEGEPYLRESLALANKILPKEDAKIFATEGALGECLTAQKRYEEAEPPLIESYEGLKRALGAGNPQTKLALQRLVKLYENWGRLDAANQYRDRF